MRATRVGARTPPKSPSRGPLARRQLRRRRARGTFSRGSRRARSRAIMFPMHRARVRRPNDAPAYVASFGRTIEGRRPARRQTPPPWAARARDGEAVDFHFLVWGALGESRLVERSLTSRHGLMRSPYTSVRAYSACTKAMRGVADPEATY